MKINIIGYHIGIHGSMMNLLDLQHYLLSKGHEVIFYGLGPDVLIDAWFKSKRKYKIEHYCDVRKDTDLIKPEDVVITDFKSLTCLNDIPIVCRRLIVFDNAELSYHLNNMKVQFYRTNVGDIRNCLNKHTFKDVMFLMPPCNIKQWVRRYPDIPAVPFFKQINMDVLSTISVGDNGRNFYRIEDGNDVKGIFKKDKEYVADTLDRMREKFPGADWLTDLTQMFNYQGYIWYRRKDRGFWEQYGRMVFEFKLLGKKVYFLDDPWEKPDGMRDYWNHFCSGGSEKLKRMMEADYDFRPWEL